MQILAGIALNPHTKKPLAPDKLVRLPSDAVVVSDEEKKADLKRKMEAFKRFKNGVNK